MHKLVMLTKKKINVNSRVSSANWRKVVENYYIQFGELWNKLIRNY